MSNSSVTIRLAPHDIELLDLLIENGYFTNRSDALRTSFRHYTQKFQKMPVFIQEMSEKADHKGITTKDIVEASRKNRKSTYEELYEND